eukprot:CAMPEP_0198243978 /NCGR_PEP_ID=MMETSP1446-20131203/32228_1 /TAXON_ID=1461542 ORGANISM="Unidentified sp, Strain CCMP2111" /NCGR_SAMPLE_ID=MMETSP1446 /ASSEMBLY_ACC=CAM_ASM_001112 /LENGTH=72 /DNA_ID=CAMNT_0043927931 /DNA_START=30 /DNA_END=244 /DNA_ORIENTATION=+
MARAASDGKYDFVLIQHCGSNDSSGGGGNGSPKESPVLKLQDIRKELSSHMILTSKFCRAVGGPKSSFNVGA